jgi:predicted dehydrogenase
VNAWDELDAGVIATPSRSHPVIAEVAIWSGKHVLVEKPLRPTSPALA